MDHWAKFNRRAFDFWTSVATAQVHAALTIATRLPILLDASTPKSRRRAEREARAMVIEKAEAIGEGARRGVFTAARLAPTTGSHPGALAAALTKVGQDMFEPARKRVRANAHRLTKI